MSTMLAKECPVAVLLAGRFPVVEWAPRVNGKSLPTAGTALRPPAAKG